MYTPERIPPMFYRDVYHFYVLYPRLSRGDGGAEEGMVGPGQGWHRDKSVLPDSWGVYTRGRAERSEAERSL